MSEGTLITQDSINQLIESTEPGKFVDEKSIAVVTKVGDWLPFIQLMGGNSIEVKRGQFPIGHFCLKKNRTMIDLGSEVIMYLIDYRPKAMIFKPKAQGFFDPNSKEFIEITKTADNKNSGKAFGAEFLVWLPQYEELCTYFLGNKTGRNEAPALMSVIKNGSRKCVQQAHLIEQGEYSWHGPRTTPYDLDIKMPDPGLLMEELKKFRNPPATQNEPMEEAEADGRR